MNNQLSILPLWVGVEKMRLLYDRWWDVLLLLLLTHSYTQFAFIINAHDDVKSRVYSINRRLSFLTIHYTRNYWTLNYLVSCQLLSTVPHTQARRRHGREEYTRYQLWCTTGIWARASWIARSTWPPNITFRPKTFYQGQSLWLVKIGV